MSLHSRPGFFGEPTFANCKCRDLLVAGAHTAYGSREDFDRVQSRRATALVQKPIDGEEVPNHPRRRRPGNQFLLTGVLFSGTCGDAMAGTRARGLPNYRCGRKQRKGPGNCRQKSIVTHHLYEIVCGWVVESVISMDNLPGARSDLSRALSGPAGDMCLRQTVLPGERERAARAIQNLLDGLEKVGYTPELEMWLGQLRAELRGARRNWPRFRRGSTAGACSSRTRRWAACPTRWGEALLGGEPDEVRGELRKVILRADLHPDRLAVQYVRCLWTGPRFQGHYR